MTLIAPNRKPRDFGFGPRDHHLVINAASRTCKAFAHNGNQLWELPALADGQHPNWRAYQGDTPPGLYRIGQCWIDYPSPTADQRTRMSFGWVTLDLIDLEGNEDRNNRSGIAIHGGGTGLGQHGSWQPKQQLLPTWGCIRMHNQDLLKIVPLTEQGRVFVSVFQDNV